MSTPPFKILGETLWWECPGCGRNVHLTRTYGLGVMAGADFRCSDDCKLRHCVEWQSPDSDISDAKIYSYDRCTCDMSQLPPIARL